MRRGGPLADTLSALRERAEHTPASRERHVDFLRAVAIGVVVVGHWLAMAVVSEDGELTGSNALDILTWAHPLTWILQVMPIFFLVGGFANAASLVSQRRKGGDSFSWMLRRTDRLLRPVTPLLIVLPLAALVTWWLGVDTGLIGTATWIATIPLWFLLAYLAVVVLTPAMHALHRRFGLWTLVAMMAFVAVADLLWLGLGVPHVGEANYLIFWLAVHQFGFSWQDGRIPLNSRFAAALTAVGLAALLLLTLPGPYEIRMVGVNTDPPTVALLALATTWAGVVLLLRPAVDRWLQRTRPWTVVVAINSVILTMFVWHMTAAVVAAVVVFPTGLMAQPQITSLAWLAWRVPWVASAAVVLVVLVGAFGRVEMRAGPSGGTEQGWLRDAGTLLGVAAVLGGLTGIALADNAYHGPGGLPAAAVLSYLAGAAVLRLVRTRLP